MINHPSLLVNILVVFGEGFWVLGAASQLRKIVKTRNPHGLSAVSQTLHAAGQAAWMTYFFTHRLWFPVASNVILFSISIPLIGFILSNRKQFTRGLIAIAILAPLTSYVLVTNPGLGGWLGMVYNGIAATPQLLKIIRRKKTSGLSERAIYFTLGAMSCVLAYALIINSWPLIVGCIQGFVFNSIIIRYYYRYRKSKP